MYQNNDTLLTCDIGSFNLSDDNKIEADCKIKGPFKMLNFYTLAFTGSGSLSDNESISMRADVFDSFDKDCPQFSIEFENLVPA